MCEDYANAGKTQPLLQISSVIISEVLHLITSSSENCNVWILIPKGFGETWEMTNGNV